MAGEEAEHDAEGEGGGRLAAGPPGGQPAGPAGEHARAAAQSTAEAKPDPTAASAAGDASAGPSISAEPARDVASGDPAEEVTPPVGVSDQEFGLAVDVIYHRARAAFFATQHRLFLFGTIMAGSAAATDIVNAKGCAFLAAALGTLDLVLDPTTRMVDHRDNARDTLAIVADLSRNDHSDEACRRARDEEFRISASERAPFNALRTMAFNQAVTAFGKPEDMRVWVPFERRLFANLLRFEGWADAKPGRWARLAKFVLRRTAPTT